jgi:hypothetical protein
VKNPLQLVALIFCGVIALSFCGGGITALALGAFEQVPAWFGAASIPILTIVWVARRRNGGGDSNPPPLLAWIAAVVVSSTAPACGGVALPCTHASVACALCADEPNARARAVACAVCAECSTGENE